MKHKIKQPSNKTFNSQTMKGTLTWSPTFGFQKTEHFHAAQVFVDSEVLRHNSPLVPFKTGTLDKSGKLGTALGTGEVRYLVPYGSFQYYCTAETRSYDAQRGGMFFERMKTMHRADILKGTKKIMKGG